MQEQPGVITTTQNPSKTMSIISLVLGIFAMLLGIAAIVSVPLGIAAIVTGIVAIRRRGGKGMAIAGIITGSLGIIIGLIGLLLVFMAVPALQRNQRDTQIQNDVSAAISAVSTYRANNQGALPSKETFDSAEFRTTYLDSMESDVDYNPGMSCDGAVGPSSTYSVSALLETGSRFCLE